VGSIDGLVLGDTEGALVGPTVGAVGVMVGTVVGSLVGRLEGPCASKQDLVESRVYLPSRLSYRREEVWWL
jgi:phage tail tape-measure protein